MPCSKLNFELITSTFIIEKHSDLLCKGNSHYRVPNKRLYLAGSPESFEFIVYMLNVIVLLVWPSRIIMYENW